MEMQHGYVAKGVGERLEPFTFQAPELKEDEVRVSVTHCGLCHTDINAIDDWYGITKFPFVPGHEIVGYVSEIGAGVFDKKVGDRVGIGWQGRSCKECEWCLRGEEQLCYKIVRDATWRPYGGFSSSVVVDSSFAYRLPHAMPSEEAAVMMCAGVTVYNPLRAYASQPGRKIGIIGVGGLGHLAIQFAHALGYDVTAMSSSPRKRDEALSFGADHFLDVNDEAGMDQQEYAFDMLLCTAHGDIVWEPLLDTLKKKGSLVLVGFPRLDLNPTDLVAHQLSITSSFLGNHATMREMLSFASEHKIAPRVELMPMSQVNEAILRVRENKARYRIVLVNEGHD